MSRRRKTNRKELKVPENHIIIFNTEEIRRLANEYGLKVNFKSEGRIVEIKSKMNLWLAKENDNTIKLYHITKYGHHWQRDFLDYNFLLKSVRDHDDWKTEEDRGNRIYNVYKCLESGNIPRVSFN